MASDRMQLKQIKCVPHIFGLFGAFIGDCIDIADLCDGQSNCFDQSDELVKYCAAIDCQRFAFRCANGACISTKLKCDGHINCIDGK